MCFTLDMLPYGNEDKTPQTCLRQASSPTLQGSQRLAAIRRKKATNASDSEHRAPWRSRADVDFVWGADCRWQSFSADRVGRRDRGGFRPSIRRKKGEIRRRHPMSLFFGIQYIL